MITKLNIKKQLIIHYFIIIHKYSLLKCSCSCVCAKVNIFDYLFDSQFIECLFI